MAKDKSQANNDIGKDGSEQRARYIRQQGNFTEEEELEVRQQWASVEEYNDFLELNRAFLNGEVKLSCYHMGPIYQETKAMLPGLLRLHDYGMLTFESQPSKFIERTTEDCPCCGEEKYVETQQRAFITFILPYENNNISQKAMYRFLLELMIDDNFYVSILNFDRSCRFGRCKKNVRIASSFPANWATHINISVRRTLQGRNVEEELLTYYQAPTKDELVDAIPRTRQWIDPECCCMLDAFRSDANVLENVHPLLVHVLAKRWEEQDLPGLVEKAAIRAGMEPAFAV